MAGAVPGHGVVRGKEEEVKAPVAQADDMDARLAAL